MKNPKEETENHMNGEHPDQGVPSFNQLSDASIDGIMVFDSELKVCYFNKKIYEIIGNSDKPITLGMGFRELRNISKLFEHIGNILRPALLMHTAIPYNPPHTTKLQSAPCSS